MEIVIEAPRFILWIVLGIDVVAVSSVLLKKGQLAKRIAALGVVAVVSVLMLVFLYRPGRLSVTQEALVDGTYMRTVSSPWSEVRRAFVVRGFAQGQYRPTIKVNGNGLPKLKTGCYRLAGGQTARVVIQSSADALVLETDRTLYVLAPDRLAELVAAVRQHVAVEEGTE
jgi:hypothetical protein